MSSFTFYQHNTIIYIPIPFHLFPYNVANYFLELFNHCNGNYLPAVFISYSVYAILTYQHEVNDFFWIYLLGEAKWLLGIAHCQQRENHHN